MPLPSFLTGLLAGELPPDLPWEALLPRLREERLSPFVYTQLRADAPSGARCLASRSRP
jgi:hypothetical protein